jgi:hypothetical protein
MEGGAVGHNFEMGLPKDYPCQVWFNLVQRFQGIRFKCDLLKITFKSSPLKPLNQITLNLAGMVLGWVPFIIVSDRHDTLPYGHAPTYQISLTYLKRKKCNGPDKKILFKKQLFDEDELLLSRVYNNLDVPS